MKPKLAVLSGAGISAESGLKTFRDAGGLWEGHRVQEVATPEAWARDPELVLRFYNLRRDDLRKAQPNAAHRFFAELESQFEVMIITQNVDDLHERAGSSRVLHLHGQLMQARSTEDSKSIYDLGTQNIQLGDLAPDGAQLRPHIVWFGEDVPAMLEAVEITSKADIFVVIGTSLAVYPAASLVYEIPTDCRRFVIDKHLPDFGGLKSFTTIEASATEGVEALAQLLGAAES
ncbi:MAG: Sir2 family NAD-dependent protein deacetylase [Verrucomicrobiota bacterium]